MELLDRYLIAVGQNLPKPQRDDIIRELCENIRSQFEDKEAELGRPLNEAEQEAILKQVGNPLLVAGRYRQDDRNLALGSRIIGPALFPFYVKVLWFNIGVSSFITALILLALFQAGVRITLSGAISSLFWTVLSQFVVITLIFAGVERHVSRFPDRWDFRKPRESGLSRLLDHAEPDGAEQVSRFQSLARFIAGAVFLVWIRVVTHSPVWMFGAAVGAFRIEPIWHRIYVPFVLVVFAGMIQAVINFIRPDWVRFEVLARAVLSLAGLGILALLATGGPLLTVRDAVPTQAQLRVVHTVNEWFLFYFSMLAIAVACVVVFGLGPGLLRTVRSERARRQK
jgi:hypothetical protein